MARKSVSVVVYNVYIYGALILTLLLPDYCELIMLANFFFGNRVNPGKKLVHRYFCGTSHTLSALEKIKDMHKGAIHIAGDNVNIIR